MTAPSSSRPIGGNEESPAIEADKLALFGWLRGTVVSIGDLTEPAGPAQSKSKRARRA